jgi:hypothetical protein
VGLINDNKWFGGLIVRWLSGDAVNIPAIKQSNNETIKQYNNNIP